MPTQSRNYENKLWRCWRKPTKLTNEIWWSDKRLRVMFEQSLDLTFDNDDMLADVQEVCSALKQKSITRAECNWDVAAMEDNC
jgi:hypothetical protein